MGNVLTHLLRLRLEHSSRIVRLLTGLVGSTRELLVGVRELRDLKLLSLDLNSALVQLVRYLANVFLQVDELLVQLHVLLRFKLELLLQLLSALVQLFGLLF